MSDIVFKRIKASLQQYKINNDPYPCRACIPYPDSDKKFKMLVTKKMIWFKGPCYVEGDYQPTLNNELN